MDRPRPRDLCEIFHTQRLRVVCLDPRNCFCRPVALISQCCDRPKACALRSPKDSVNDLALNQFTQNGDVLRRIQQVHESAACVEEFHCGFTGRHGGTVGGDSATCISSRLRSSRITGISSFRDIARQGVSSLAATIWLTIGQDSRITPCSCPILKLLLILSSRPQQAPWWQRKKAQRMLPQIRL